VVKETGMKIVRRRNGVRVEMLYRESGNVVLNIRRGPDERKGFTTDPKGRVGNGRKGKKAEEDVERLPFRQPLPVGENVQTQG
jgi:hypothetical protein